jgi:hypothetical protein
VQATRDAFTDSLFDSRLQNISGSIFFLDFVNINLFFQGLNVASSAMWRKFRPAAANVKTVLPGIIRQSEF